ncbi:isocitrate lyase/phosphoenolpyruvate mutase family protein [Ramlibacter tataouinensis]|uniref:isocitrate lyase/PEP mutase family protein n=1 Tax=Ramlibacter tataouinensis TaxID=94132 RepID=UPI0022F3BA09|nr:isocitrate lyase/phosphoenolpyruvate mutase family protein [Ramlibacter tataouinensis]WBY03994.1 isocitrate lyase/phosphoenolpyruvate mutase family protein [Ramlibacter tataouinensis]
MASQHDKAQRMVQLHAQPGCFVIPNFWDVGSARLLESLGFQALASSSAGFAFSRGLPDMGVTRQAKLQHLREVCAATSLPVSADLQNGFGHRPEDAAETIRLAAQAGVVGGSIEDCRGPVDDPIYELSLARERVQAAAEAARALPFPFTLTARAENHLWGRDDLDDTIRRLQAYEAAGADVLFAPGLKTAGQIRAVLAAVTKPVNVIMGAPGMGLDLAQLQAMGVRRISVGGSLARTAYAALLAAGREMRDQGTFGYAREVPSTDWFNDAFGG